MILCRLVIHRPPVFLPKFIAGLFQCQIGSQIFLVEWFPRKRVRLGSFEMFEYGGPVVGTSRLSDDGVVHDRKGDVVDKIVWHLLYGTLACFWESCRFKCGSPASANIEGPLGQTDSAALPLFFLLRLQSRFSPPPPPGR